MHAINSFLVKYMKKDYSFLNKVVVFDNQGKTLDRYTIVFQDGSNASSSTHPTSPNGFYQRGEGINYTPLDFYDGERCHLTDKEDIKAYNKVNKHLGKYKTFNAMKRLPKQVLDCIKEDVEVVDVCEAIENEYYCSPRPKITEAFLREELAFGDKQIEIAKNYCGLIEF
jgi:hypothetical protein